MAKYYWRHFSGNNEYEIHLIEEDNGTYRIRWNFMFDGTHKSVLFNNNPIMVIGKDNLKDNYRSMDSFPYHEAPYIFKAIFTKLKDVGIK